MLIVLIILFIVFLSMLSGGLAYRKRRDLFGKDAGNDCETDDNCKPHLSCNLGMCEENVTTTPSTNENSDENSCVVDTDCKANFVCDSDSFTCQPAPVPDPVDCEGEYEDWSDCVYPTNDPCATVGEQTRQFNQTNDGPEHGGRECPKDVETQPCSETRVVPSTCNVDCIGRWKTRNCPTTGPCSDTTVTEKYNVIANAVGTGHTCPHTDGETRQKECKNPCSGPPENCQGHWAPENCGFRGCGQPSITKTKTWIKTRDAKNGGSCPLENQTLNYTCNATAACHKGEDIRDIAHRASNLFKNQNKKVRIFKFDNGRKKCLGVDGGDAIIGKKDGVGFHDCDRNHHDILNTWKIKDKRIETWHDTDKFHVNGRAQPLCLDYDKGSFKITQCVKNDKGEEYTGNDLTNRTYTLLNHDKMTWARQSNLVHDGHSYTKWVSIAPVKIRTGHDNKCIRDAGSGSKRVGDCNENEELYITDKNIP